MLTSSSAPTQEYTTINFLIDQILIKKIDDYLQKRELGKKFENAELAKKNIIALRDSTESAEIIFEKISNTLNDWEKNNDALKEQYWTPEFTSETPALIADCQAEVKAWLEIYIKKPVLHAFPNQINMSIEDQLFAMLKAQDYPGFQNLILQNPKGYNVNAKDKEEKTLLHCASINSDILFLSLLLQEGANPNIGDKNGWTPVHWAAYAGKNAYITLFIENSQVAVDWDLLTNSGKTVYDIALSGAISTKEKKLLNAKHDEVIQILTDRILNPATSKLTATLLSPS